MYVKQTVFYFLVIYTINTSAENAVNDLDLARVFRTPKDFSRVNFDHFEILERNNFDPTPVTQQESETANDDVPPTAPVPDQQHPKSVANAQVMLRFGGDDIHGKNCIQTPRIPCPSPIRPYPPNNHLPQMNEIIRYHSPYCHPSYHTLPFFPPPPPSYGYPYPPFAFPGPYYPRSEYGRGPCGVYEGRLYPGDDSSLCRQDKRNFLEGNGVSGSTSASHPKIIMTDEVIPEYRKNLGSPIKSSIEMSPPHHHYHQNRPSEYYNPNTSGTGIYPENVEEENILKSDSSYRTPISFTNVTDSGKFPDFIKKTDISGPEWSKIVFVKPPKDIGYQQHSASYTTKNDDGQFPDSMKKVDGVEPGWSEVVDMKPKGDNSYFDQPSYTIDPQNGFIHEERPDKFPDFIKKDDLKEPSWTEDIHVKPIGSRPNANNQGKFTDFIKEEDLSEPEWSKDIKDEPSIGTCNHQHHHRPCNHPENLPNENDYGKFPDFIKKQDLIEPEWSKVIYVNNPQGKCNHQQPHHSCDPSESHSNEESGKFRDFMRKKDLVDPEWSKNIHIEHSRDECEHRNSHLPCNHPETYPNENGHDKFPDFIKKEELVKPDSSKDENVRPSEGKCNHQNPHHPCNHPETYPDKNDDDKFTDSIKKEDLVQPGWSEYIQVEPSNGEWNHQHPHHPFNNPENYRNENDHGKFPDFIKKEDLIEPGWSEDIHSKHSNGNSGSHPNEKDLGKFPDFIKKEDLVEPEWSKDIHINPPNSNGKCNHQHPHRPCNHPEIRPNENDHGEFTDFIKKENVKEPEWSKDINIKPLNPYGQCNQQHPHRPCNNPEIRPNENDHGEFPDFIKKEDVKEPEWSKDINIEPLNPNGKCNDQHPHRPCYHQEIRPNENDQGEFPDFIKKEDVVELEWPEDIHIKPVNPNGKCNHQHPHHPCNYPGSHPTEKDHGKFPDFLKKEDVVEPEWSKDIHIEPDNSNGKCNHQHPHRPCKYPEIGPNENDHGKFPDFIKKEDVVQPEWIKDIHIKPKNPNFECSHQHQHRPCNYQKIHIKENDHGKFPDFIKNEDLVKSGRSEDIQVKFPQDNYNHHPHHLPNPPKSDTFEKDHGKFPDFVTKEDFSQSNWSGNIHLEASNGNSLKKKYFAENERFTDLIKNEDLVEPEKSIDFSDREDSVESVKFSDFIGKGEFSEPAKSMDHTKKEELMKPGELSNSNKKKGPEIVNTEKITDKDGNSYYNLSPYTIDHQKSPNEDDPGKFPDFIKKEDLMNKNWSDIGNVKSPRDDRYHPNPMDSPVENPNGLEKGKFPDILKKQDLIEPDEHELLNSGSLSDDSQIINDSEHSIPQVPTSTVIEGDDSTTINGVLNSESSKSPEYAQPIYPQDVEKVTHSPEVQQSPHMYLLPVDKPLKKYIQIKPMVIYVNQKPGPGIYNDVQGAKREPNINEIEGWLNKSLVPYVCKACGHKPKLLVTYPLKNDGTQLEEDINISGCQCCRQKGFCDCCNCHRNPSIPFGHRFPSDVDSLLQVTKPPAHDEGRLSHIYYDGKRPGEYSTGYSSSSASSLSSSVSQVGDQRPKVYLNGYHSSEGSGYYSDPTRDVLYQRPKVLDFVRTTSPYLPVIQHSRMEEPEWYSVVPKYNIVPKKITSIDIPDLVATGVFVCKQCNTPHHRGIVCHREYVPRAVIEEEPILKRPLWRDLRSY